MVGTSLRKWNTVEFGDEIFIQHVESSLFHLICLDQPCQVLSGFAN